MPTPINSSDGISVCMKNATDWLNEYGLNDHLGTVSKYSPDVMTELQKKMDKVDELWLRVRKGETSVICDTKEVILDWFISWRILIDSVRGVGT